MLSAAIRLRASRGRPCTVRSRWFAVQVSGARQSHDALADRTHVSDAPAPSGPVGLGGWLVLVGLGLFLSPLFVVYRLWRDFVPIFREGSWEAITTPGNAAYNLWWGPLILAEAFINVVIIAVSILLLVLFFERSNRFPRLFVIFYVSTVLIALLEGLALSLIPQATAAMGIAEPLRGIGPAMIGALIWWAYMVKSRRVKNTFVVSGSS